ncbi:hypothetical protein AU374_00983 [Cupriavidus metallidurans]|uniref:hypothetical protein n=1 Tax=Cupriavidus metallidurans TaxID=119219 RepID=UPI00076386FE|nr:hypothetical protein [Cupriavidus metallidurans]KWW38197.1 hypothetical protein AU374_00983 [Cupriavidus metallidurans]
MLFVDWLNCSQQFPAGAYPDFLGGRVVSIDGACGLQRAPVLDRDTGALEEQWSICGGEDELSIEFDSAKFASHRGTYETNLMVRMIGGKLEVRGNPSGFGRLDNVFGYSLDDAIEVYNEVLESLGLPCFTQGEETQIWLQNEQKFHHDYTGVKISRVDLTENRAVGMGNVRNYHRWLTEQKLYRKSPDDESLEKFAKWNWDSVYTSESKFWINVKHYDKAQALEQRTLPEYEKRLKRAAREGRINRKDVRPMIMEAEDYLMKLAEWCAEIGMTRGEWSLRSRWFQQHKGAGWWTPGETEAALVEVVEAEMGKIATRAVVYQEDQHDALTDREYRVLEQWKAGEVVKDLLTKPTFYRLRAAILEKTGHDIAARPVLGKAKDFRPVYFQVRQLSLADAPIWYQRPVLPERLAA